MKFLNKIIDKFMRFILCCQNGIFVLKELCEVHYKMQYYIIGGNAALFFIFTIFRNVFLSTLFLALLCATVYLRCLIGASSSASDFFVMILAYNLIAIVLAFAIIYSHKNNDYFFENFRIIVSIYFTLWVFMSLIIKINIARIINEIMSGILTILFTAGTFISSLNVPNFTYEELNSIDSIQFDEILNSEFATRVLQAVKYYVLMDVYKFVLPFLCISVTSLVAISVKEYWMKKNGLKEVWNDELDAEEQIVALNQRVDELVDDITILKEKNIELNSKVEEILQKENE